jgi:pilus assembly protein CpaB
MAERRYTLVFSAAVLTAVAATFGVYRVLQTTKEQSRVPTSRVVVAAKDLPEGANIDKTMLAVKEWPVAAVPAGAVTVVDSLVGRVTRVAVFTGEAFVAGRLAPHGSGAGLEVKIAPGKRAMAIRINDVAGIAGLIQPNSRVDVLVTMREGGGAQERQVAKLFMENMRVLSVGTQFERGEDGKPMPATTATLEVTPQESERLAVASNAGSIQLVLRGYGDPNSSATRGATSNEVVAQLGAPRPAPAPAAPAPPVRRPAPPPAARPLPPALPAPVAAPPAPRPVDSVTVTVFRGEKASQQKFSKPDSVGKP